MTAPLVWCPSRVQCIPAHPEWHGRRADRPRITLPYSIDDSNLPKAHAKVNASSVCKAMNFPAVIFEDYQVAWQMSQCTWTFSQQQVPQNFYHSNLHLQPDDKRNLLSSEKSMIDHSQLTLKKFLTRTYIVVTQGDRVIPIPFL
ncbi:hypothetical protein TNCV_2537871 [Trichonephila clavipes]|nr:hypothetical protein TNCV_2537871 [Trichonephila clavipes]